MLPPADPDAVSTDESSRVVHTDGQRRTFEESSVAELWRSRAVSTRISDRKRIEHPDLGSITLDCDVLTVSGCELRVVPACHCSASSNEPRKPFDTTIRRCPS